MWIHSKVQGSTIRLEAFEIKASENVVRTRETVSGAIKDSTYHKEKMLLCKQAEKGVQLQAEQSDWLADTDEEIDEQELEAHYSYMAKIQEVPNADSGTDSEPLEQVQYDTDDNVFANDIQHFDQSESINQNDVECDDERVALANLKLDVDENKKIQKQLKKANATLTQELTECKSILAETSRTLGESNSIRDSCLVALQNKQTEFESTAFHPQTDGQSERTIQTLEDMLRACALEWTGSWDEYLCLVEFAYNNSWHASIKAAPFELLYGRKCRAPICWDEVGERLIEGPELIEITNEKVAVAKEKLKEARSRQKSYADKHRRDLEFQVGDRVFLKVSPFRGVKRFGIKGKLSPRFIGPFEILERIGEVSYRLALPPQLSHVHDVFHVSLLRGYHYHPLHVASYPFDQIQPDMSLSEEPESILDRQERVMRNKVIPFVKILWKNHPEREATWETEESMRASYPHFFV
ncbi:putative nucleotidyltransferase, ribonuclease H [Tanacetum coccineum]|uniref:Nucleotidyltransferase, ribonuclease H n=1 Tax=Tanacetum coccineum TaxID=301880 RepID=A0ABQ5IQ33_9ASTR